MNKRFKFHPGQKCSCPGLYGGTLGIEIVSRTDRTVSFVYDERTSDDRSIQEAEIIIQETNILDNNLVPIEKVDVESIVAWDYRPPYSKNEAYYGYYFAFDANQPYSKQEWEEICREWPERRADA